MVQCFALILLIRPKSVLLYCDEDKPLFCRYATILAFDVKVERDAQDLADTLGVKIFQADIIYHLFDKFMAYREELRQRKREEFKHVAVFPCKLKVLPQVRKNFHDILS
jgi:translation initiation factor 5B